MGGRIFKELSGLVVSYSWVFQDESSQEMACPVKGLNLVATYPGEKGRLLVKMKEEDMRGSYCNLPPCT